MSELKPCPFCGGEAIPCSTGNHFATEKFFVLCGVCEVETPRIARTRKEAIAAWNRRADDDTNVATNADRIRGMNDEELAEYIFGLGNGPENCDEHCAYQDDCNAEGFNYNTCIKACIKGVTDWLKQPVKEE